jgi:hypothetical protein
LPFNFSVSRLVGSQGSFAAIISGVGVVQPASQLAKRPTTASRNPVRA